MLMKEVKSASIASETASPPSDQQLYDENGVDITLIRWMLSLTPSERLQVLQQNVRSLARLRNESSRT
jgi:hypothetical protein